MLWLPQQDWFHWVVWRKLPQILNAVWDFREILHAHYHLIVEQMPPVTYWSHIEPPAEWVLQTHFWNQMPQNMQINFSLSSTLPLGQGTNATLLPTKWPPQWMANNGGPQSQFHTWRRLVLGRALLLVFHVLLCIFNQTGRWHRRCGLVGQSACLVNRRSWVQLPAVPQVLLAMLIAFEQICNLFLVSHHKSWKNFGPAHFFVTTGLCGAMDSALDF